MTRTRPSIPMGTPAIPPEDSLTSKSAEATDLSETTHIFSMEKGASLMRQQFTLTSMVCCLVMLSSSAVHAVSFQLFSSGLEDIYRHSVTGSGTPTANGSISLGSDNPGKMVVSPDNELFVSVGSADSVNRYVDLGGAFIANPTNPTITSLADIDNPNGLRFLGDELFVNSIVDNKISRYTFDGSGAAVSNPPFVSTSGDIASTKARGVAFSPSGDQMFVTGCCTPSTAVAVYAVDGFGVVTPQSTIAVSEFASLGITINNIQGITVSDTGEVWLAESGTTDATSEVVKAIIDGSGALTTASIAIPGSHANLFRPIDLAFAPDGELFIANLGTTGGSGDGFLSRFTFDGGGAIASSSQFGIANSYRGVSIFYVPPVVPEPSSFLLMGLGVLGLVRHNRRRGRRVS